MPDNDFNQPAETTSPEAGLAAAFFPSLGLADNDNASADEASDQAALESEAEGQETSDSEAETTPADNSEEIVEINRHKYNAKDVPPEYLALHKQNRAEQSKNDALTAQMRKLEERLNQLTQQPAQQQTAAQLPVSVSQPAQDGEITLPPAMRTQLEDMGFPAEALEQFLASSYEQKTKGLMNKISQLEAFVPALLPVAEQQANSRLDAADTEQLGIILSHPTFADIEAEPQQVLQRMREVQKSFMDGGLEQGQAFNQKFSELAFKQAIQELRFEALQSATPAPPIPRLKPVPPLPPTRGGSRGTAPAASVQNRDPQGRFRIQSANAAALSVFDNQ